MLQKSEELKPEEDSNKNSKPPSVAGGLDRDDPSHITKDCPKPRNFVRAAARKLEYLQKKKTANSAHAVLALLCHQMGAEDEV